MQQLNQAILKQGPIGQPGQRIVIVKVLQPGLGFLFAGDVLNDAHPEAPIFQELRGIVLKTFGVADELRRVLAPFSERIIIAFVYGSLAKGADTAGSDIDVMIVSEQLNYPEVINAFADAEGRLGRPINPTLYNPAEIRRKLAEDNNFLKTVIRQEKIFLIGSDDDIPKP